MNASIKSTEIKLKTIKNLKFEFKTQDRSLFHNDDE